MATRKDRKVETDALDVREFVADERTRTLAREARQRASKGGETWTTFGMSALPTDEVLDTKETAARKDYHSARDAYVAARQAKANAAHIRKEYILTLDTLGRVGKSEGCEFVSWAAVASRMGVSGAYVSKVRKAAREAAKARDARAEIRQAAKDVGLDSLSPAAVTAAVEAGPEAVAAAVDQIKAGKPLDAPVRTSSLDDVRKAVSRVTALVIDGNVDCDDAAALDALATDLRKASEALRMYARSASA